MTSETSTFPFPLRPSEINNQEIDSNIEPIPLSEKEKKSLLEGEKVLFEQVAEIKEIKTSNHVLYINTLLTEQGQQLFSNIYIHWPEIENQVSTFLEETSLDINDEKTARQIWSSVFLDLTEKTKGQEQPESHFENLIKKNGYDGQKVKINLVPSKNLSLKEIKDIITTTDLKSIPKEIRVKMNKHTSDLAKQSFKEDFKEKNFNVNEIDNPNRTTQIVSPQDLEKKITEFKKLKKEIVKKIQEKKEKGDNLSQAEVIVLQLYQKFINVNLARIYRSNEKYKSKGERLDHFINGVDSSFQTIPQQLENLLTSRLESKENNEFYKKYNSIKVDKDLAKKISEQVIKIYGWDKINNPWKVIIRSSSKSTLGVEPKPKFKELRIPKNFNRGMIDTLASLAHEIEGHILVHENSDNEENNLKLISNYNLGRSNVLKEAVSTYSEEETRKKIANTEENAEPYFLLALKTKKEGGTFKECFKTIFDAYRKKNNNVDFDSSFQYAYDRTLRIFRGTPSLNDDSGNINNSDQLKYIEQELVLAELQKKGLEKIVLIDGIDLNSISEILKLGIIDFDKVSYPKMVIANELWPIIKDQIDNQEEILFS